MQQLLVNSLGEKAMLMDERQSLSQSIPPGKTRYQVTDSKSRTRPKKSQDSKQVVRLVKTAILIQDSDGKALIELVPTVDQAFEGASHGAKIAMIMHLQGLRLLTWLLRSDHVSSAARTLSYSVEPSELVKNGALIGNYKRSIIATDLLRRKQFNLVADSSSRDKHLVRDYFLSNDYGQDLFQFYLSTSKAREKSRQKELVFFIGPDIHDDIVDDPDTIKERQTRMQPFMLYLEDGARPSETAVLPAGLEIDPDEQDFGSPKENEDIYTDSKNERSVMCSRSKSESRKRTRDSGDSCNEGGQLDAEVDIAEKMSIDSEESSICELDIARNAKRRKLGQHNSESAEAQPIADHAEQIGAPLPYGAYRQADSTDLGLKHDIEMEDATIYHSGRPLENAGTGDRGSISANSSPKAQGTMQTIAEHGHAQSREVLGDIEPKRGTGQPHGIPQSQAAHVVHEGPESFRGMPAGEFSNSGASTDLPCINKQLREKSSHNRFPQRPHRQRRPFARNLRDEHQAGPCPDSVEPSIHVAHSTEMPCAEKLQENFKFKSSPTPPCNSNSAAVSNNISRESPQHFAGYKVNDATHVCGLSSHSKVSPRSEAQQHQINQARHLQVKRNAVYKPRGELQASREQSLAAESQATISLARSAHHRASDRIVDPLLLRTQAKHGVNSKEALALEADLVSTQNMRRTQQRALLKLAKEMQEGKITFGNPPLEHAAAQTPATEKHAGPADSLESNSTTASKSTISPSLMPAQTYSANKLHRELRNGQHTLPRDHAPMVSKSPHSLPQMPLKIAAAEKLHQQLQRDQNNHLQDAAPTIPAFPHRMQQMPMQSMAASKLHSELQDGQNRLLRDPAASKLIRQVQLEGTAAGKL